MKYKVPVLYKVNSENSYFCACMDGDAASHGLSCKAGPEAGGSGCGSGAAAGKLCVDGAAAGLKCTNGACFE